MKRSQLIPRAMTVIGAALVVFSIVWEYVRMKPDYRFLVEPWSLRGFETVQGWVTLAIGVGLLLLTLVALKEDASLLLTITAAVVAWIASILVTDLADPDPVDLELTPPVAVVVTAIGMWIIVASMFAIASARIRVKRRSLVLIGVWLVVTLIVYLALIAPTIVSSSREVPVATLVGLGYGIVLFGALAGRPRELASVRILLVSIFSGWIYITVMGASTRSRLITEQLETTGVTAQYKDTQITSGIMIAFAGALIAFFGAAGIWAERRDRLAVQARARRQHEAALESAAELNSAV